MEQIYPLDQVLTAPYLNDEWKPELITQLLSELVPSKCRVIVIGQSYEEQAKLSEPYYQTKYGTLKIDNDTLKVHAGFTTYLFYEIHYNVNCFSEMGKL